ncbi:hypothetical protein B0J11DRAFT_592857 [Dendryphion nanum]|uniref:Uncharacterized protein n=1 Tax=Dendryphion nanum TaxID=256645 RepID=A0A9P9IEG3_9PLEO|nr:hypothetical protein B0J11DRAFT_592857 [Dendryphion nanum]
MHLQADFLGTSGFPTYQIMSTDPYVRYRWTETERGRWERDIDEAEQFYTSVAKNFEASGRMFFAITGHISLSVPISPGQIVQDQEHRVEEALRKAWICIRYDHPTIASWTEFNEKENKCKKIYETVSDAAGGLKNQRAWLKQSFQTLALDIATLEWCNSDPPAPKLPTLFIITPPSPPTTNPKTIRRDIVLRSPHDILDGMGTLHLLNNLITHAHKAYELQASFQLPVFGSEYTNLSPPFRVAANILPTPTSAQLSLHNELLACNTAARSSPSHALLTSPFTPGPLIPGKHQHANLSLSPSQTTALLNACKARNVTITHAFHASIALYLRSLSHTTKNPSHPLRYISYALVNERPSCVPPFNSPKHPVSVYHSVSANSLIVDMAASNLSSPSPISQSGDNNDDDDEQYRQDFTTVLAQVSSFYSSLKTSRSTDPNTHLSLIPLQFSASTPKPTFSPYPSLPPPLPAPNTRPSISISSLGRIDDVIAPVHGDGVFVVGEPWVTGEELGTGMGVFLGSWEGGLRVGIVWNDAWYQGGEGRGVLEGVVRGVGRGFRVRF